MANIKFRLSNNSCPIQMTNKLDLTELTTKEFSGFELSKISRAMVSHNFEEGLLIAWYSPRGKLKTFCNSGRAQVSYQALSMSPGESPLGRILVELRSFYPNLITSSTMLRS